MDESNAHKKINKSKKSTKYKELFWKTITKKWMIFLLGAIIGSAFFGLFYGYSLIYPTNVSWIYTNFAHDTGQHQMGWEFFRAGSDGGRITTLAMPNGIPISFMDSIPLFAFFFNLFNSILPDNFQYFGLFAFINYILFGGFAALILQWIFTKAFAKFKLSNENFKAQFLATFILIGAITLIVSPIMIARTFYHTALNAQWLILLGFVLILYREKLFLPGKYKKTLIKKSSKLLTKILVGISNIFSKFKSLYFAKFIFIWSLVMVIVVLIHPYFLPMMGALMVISLTLLYEKKSHKIPQSIVALIVPVILTLVVFALIGGFSLGGESGAMDVYEKGFGLLSFAFPGGYSAVFPTILSNGSVSGSPETMMWLGFGVWLMLIIGFVLWCLNIVFARKNSGKKNIESITDLFKKMRLKVREFGVLRFWIIALTLLGLLIFAMSPSIQAGGVEIFRYPVPGPILRLWRDFRACAREAWPFYYLVQFAAIYFISSQFMRFVSRKEKSDQKTFNKNMERNITILTAVLLCLALIQFIDIYRSPKAYDRTQNFAKFSNKTADYDFPIELSGIAKPTQKNLVTLDKSAFYSIRAFNITGQTAIKNNLTLNVGYFARMPDVTRKAFMDWLNKINEGLITDKDISENLFITQDAELVGKWSDSYNFVEKSGFYFVTSRK